MIQINLLDSSQSKSQRSAAMSVSSGGGSFLLAIAIVVMIGLNLALAWTALSTIAASRSKLVKVRGELASVQRQIDSKTKQAEEIKTFRDVVTNQMDVLRSLDPPDRILWSQKINMLASLIPSSVFIDDVRINEDVQMVETEASKKAGADWKASTNKKKGPEPKKAYRPVIRYHLTLSGVAEGEDNIAQFNNVMAFQRALNEHRMVDPAGHAQRFMDGFQKEIQFHMIKGDEYEGVQVNKFVFELTTLPLGEEKPRQTAEPRIASATK